MLPLDGDSPLGASAWPEDRVAGAAGPADGRGTPDRHQDKRIIADRLSGRAGKAVRVHRLHVPGCAMESTGSASRGRASSGLADGAHPRESFLDAASASSTKAPKLSRKR